ncbi:MAG: META domain-containing protein, partial [Anaerolinea sp.]|nr:META domain-containing protein [Anaerolinea sp.]
DDQGRVSGSGGCNRYGGSYDVNGDAIRFSGLFSTMMACPYLDVEQAFFAALGSAAAFELRDDSLIIRYGDAGETLMFVPAPVIEGSMWQLVAIDGTPAVDGTLVTLLFAEDGSLGGDSGCNRYRSSYTVDAEAGTLAIEPVLSTRRACVSAALSAQETALLAGLEAATRYMLRPSQLILTTAAGQRLEFAAYNPLAGTAWILEAIDGASPLAGTSITLEFVADGLSGSDGCNQYSGAYRVTATSLRVGPNLVSTQRACQPEIMDQAQAYLGALTAATGYSLAGDQLTIRDAEGGTLVFRAQQ